MFTNFLAYLVYTIIGSDQALKHEIVMRAQWYFNRQDALIEIGIGSLMILSAISIVVFFGTKVDSYFKGA